MKFDIKLKGCFLLILLFSIFNCTDNNNQSNSIDRINIGVIPSEEAERMVRRLEPIADYLSDKLGMSVKIYRANDYTAVIEGMKGKKIDVAVFGAFSYILASENANAQPLVVAGKENEPASYRSAIITHSNSGINTIEDIKNNSGKYTFSFSDPASTSGHLVPTGNLISWGIKPQEHFKNVMFSGSHTATILSVATQKIDAAGVSYTVLNKLLERGAIKQEDYKVLWISKPIPVDLVTVRADLPEELKEKLRSLYMRMKDELPEIDQYFYDEWNDSTLRFIPVEDSAYSEVRKLANYIRKD